MNDIAVTDCAQPGEARPAAETQRCFIAIDLNPETRQALAEIITRLKALGAGGISWVKPENLHITLRFLGNVKAEIMPGLGAALEAAIADSAPFKVELRGLSFFTPKQPKVIWAGVDDPEERLHGIFACLTAPLAALGFTAESRKYQPHVTLARVRHNCPPRLRDFIVHNCSQVSFGTVTVTGITLYQSRLTPAGAVYQALKKSTVPVNSGLL